MAWWWRVSSEKRRRAQKGEAVFCGSPFLRWIRETSAKAYSNIRRINLRLHGHNHAQIHMLHSVTRIRHARTESG